MGVDAAVPEGRYEVSPGDAAGGCTTTSTPTAATTVAVDVADRMLSTVTAAGTVYDEWGRIPKLPAALTSTATSEVASVTYYAMNHRTPT